MTTTPAIRVEGLSRSFGSRVALDDVDLTVAPGEVHALLGPNGAGKTTLLRIIVGSVRPSAGLVEVAGKPWPDLSKPGSRTLFGLVSAGDRSSYHRLSGLENLLFFGRLYGLSKTEAMRRAKESLATVGLADSASIRAGAYSHGMQKRLAMARALLMEPPVLLVDEATHDLDPAGARRVRQLLTEAARRGAAVLWATQRVEEIRDTADRVTVLDRGEVRFSGTVAELSGRREASRYRLELATQVAPSRRNGNGNGMVELLERIDQTRNYVLTLPDGISIGQAITSLTRQGLDVVDCQRERSEVEDAFLALTSEPAP